MEYFIIICDTPEGEPDLLGPFVSDEAAQLFIDEIPNEDHGCPNDHYWLRVHELESSETIGVCDKCNIAYVTYSGTDHCGEEGLCWNHCTNTILHLEETSTLLEWAINENCPFDRACKSHALISMHGR